MATTASRTSVPRDLALLLVRIVLGTIFLAHGAQKIWTWGLGATSEAFAGMGVPVPELAAPVVAILELAGGAALILGLLTPWAALLLAIDMLVAAVLVHAPHGVFVDAGGWELVGALGAGALALVAVGAGRISLDHALLGRRRGRRSAA